MKILKKFAEKPAGVIELCWKCHTVLHVGIGDLKIVSRPRTDDHEPVPILYNFHYRCPMCKTLVDIGSTKTDSVPRGIHDRKIRSAREQCTKLSPKQKKAGHVF